MKGLPRSNQRGNPLLQEVIKVTIPIRDLSVTVAAASSGVAFGTAVVAGLPQGNMLLLGAVAYLELSTADADAVAGWHGDFGFGYAVTADGDLGDSNEDAIIPSTTIDADGETKASVRTRAQSTQTEQSVIVDNTDGSLEVNLNVLVDAADFTDASSAVFTANGDLHLAYIMLGDD